MTEEAFNVCVSSPPTFNEDLFLKWVNGNGEDDSEYVTQQPSSSSMYDVFQFRHAPLTSTFSDDLMKLEIQEQYRVFDVLEHFICQPLLLSSQQMVLIPPHLQNIMIGYYWGLDDSIVREIVYKRLSKSRKDLDDVADATGFPLKRVTRQFDNLRRIYTFAEDIQWQCNLQACIVKNFCLDMLLARKYSCIVFLLFSKFNLTTKKRMLRITCEKLENCAALTLTFLAADSDLFFQSLLVEYELWEFSRMDKDTKKNVSYGDVSNNNHKESMTSSSSSSSSSSFNEDGSLTLPPTLVTYYAILSSDARCWPAVWRIFGTIETLELDKQMLINLRDARTMLTGDVLDAACQLVRDTIAQKVTSSSGSGSNIVARRLLDLSRIRTVLKALAQIGGHLSQTREYRDIFEDFLTKVVEPLEEASLMPAEISSFLECCLHVASVFPDNARTTSMPVGYSSASSATVSNIRSTFPTSGFDATNRNVPIFEMKNLTKTEQLRLDWLRFVAFSRLCIQHIT